MPETMRVAVKSELTLAKRRHREARIGAFESGKPRGNGEVAENGLFKRKSPDAAASGRVWIVGTIRRSRAVGLKPLAALTELGIGLKADLGHVEAERLFLVGDPEPDREFEDQKHDGAGDHGESAVGENTD